MAKVKPTAPPKKSAAKSTAKPPRAPRKRTAVAEPIHQPVVQDEAQEETFGKSIEEQQIAEKWKSAIPEQTAEKQAEAQAPVKKALESASVGGWFKSLLAGKPLVAGGMLAGVALLGFILVNKVKGCKEERQIQSNTKKVSQADLLRPKFDSLINAIEAQIKADSADRANIKASLTEAEEAVQTASQYRSEVDQSAASKLKQAKQKYENFVQRLSGPHNSVDMLREVMRAREKLLADSAR